MALEIPKQSKVYTTVYDNSRGVDFTNDATNVFRRRSPCGKNMLPSIDGKPYKRSGWKIEKSASDFKTAASLPNSTLIPDRVYYFELNGKDYMMIFNNLGLFKYVDGTLTRIASANNIDSKRAFFFEGGGTAGFYTFIGQTLYRFSVNDTGTELFSAVSPKIPVVLFACDNSGAGTLLEPVNMLTRRRIVQYLCDGTATFTVPMGFSTATGETPVVEVKDANGDWQVQTAGTDYNLSSNAQVVFVTGHIPDASVEGEDNMRITYTPKDDTINDRNNVLTPYKKISVTRKTITVQEHHISGSGLDRDITSYEWSYTSASFTLQNPKVTSGGTLDYTIMQVDSGDVKATETPYAGKVTLKAKKSLFSSNTTPSNSTSKTTSTEWKKVGTNTKRRTVTKTEKKEYYVGIKYNQWYFSSADTDSARANTAFFGTTRSMVFGNGIINQVFLTASTSKDYNTRVWYSAATDPTYFPDTNYIEVGSTDKPVMGLMRVGEYLGVVKQGSGTETSIYLAYPTSFENETTYAVKQSVNGIGAIANGAFNILNDEPLFLSAEGVIGIEPAEDESRILRNRSHYVNKKLCAENNLSAAISFVYDGMYWLAVNNHCYVLDGSQKLSWENTKTNFQYECYYLDNVPAQCFAKMGDRLYFTDFEGNLCRFKDASDAVQYSDEYSTGDVNFITASTAPIDGVYQKSALSGVQIKTETLIEDYWDFDVKSDLYDDGASFVFDSDYTSIENVSIVLYSTGSVESIEQDLAYTVTQSGGHTYLNITSGQSVIDDLPVRTGHGEGYGEYGIYITYVSGDEIEINVGDIIQNNSDFYTVSEVNVETVTVLDGVPIEAVWGTIADDDGAPHYFKNLQKKGCMVSLLPSSDSGVEVWLQADNKDPVKIGETDAKNYDLPFDFYIKKKVKKYKRLQIICKNNTVGDSFGVDQIIKSYTFGNYSKNRG